jgi:hypothetical protein
MKASDRLATLNRIRKLSRLMDTAIKIPFINFRIGLDPILGLIPGAGDLVASAFSAYIVYMATRFELPTNVIRQMIFNVALESALGTIPLLGDWFDAAYKANIRNLALLEKHLQVTEPEISELDRVKELLPTPDIV